MGTWGSGMITFTDWFSAGNGRLHSYASRLHDIILRDENEPGPPAIQSVEFLVVAPVLPEPSKDAKSTSRWLQPAAARSLRQ
jgi:hypothetical protein